LNIVKEAPAKLKEHDKITGTQNMSQKISTSQTNSTLNYEF